MKPIALVVVGGFAALSLLVWVLTRSATFSGPGTSGQPGVSDAVPESATITNPEPAASTTKRLAASEITSANTRFTWSAEVPSGWQAEAIPAIEAINLYDPGAPGESNLERSQIFIRHFEANTFLTLSTVTIHDQRNELVDGRPAVRYEIEKKGGVADFPNQPSWRNQRHVVTDVRVSDANPAVFYVIAKRPELDDAVYARFLETLQVTNETASLVPPVEQLRERVTKKPFGIEVSPGNSPVEPERFRGFHTAIDVEFDDVTAEVAVRAIATGEVLVARTADGYGGVVVIKHAIDGSDRAVIYGHLDPAMLPTVGEQVNRGDQIGRLGDGNTSETDGERKHLHFGIRTDDTVDLKGYVATEAELKRWLDPLTVL